MIRTYIIVLAVLFLTGMLYSLYRVYSIPSDFLLPAGYQGALVGTYISIIVTFLAGMAAIYLAMNDQRERIVYIERQQSEESDGSSSTQGSQHTISMESINRALQHPGKEMAEEFIKALCKQLEAGQGALYISKEDAENKKVVLAAGYALVREDNENQEFAFGEGLIGQALKEKQSIYIDDIPDGYIKVISGLGSSSPNYLLILPIVNGDRVLGAIELAFFKNLTDNERKFTEQAASLFATKLS